MPAGSWSRHHFLLTFATLNAVMGVGVGLGKIVAPLYALELGADGTWLGLVAGAQSAGVLIMGFPTGLLVDRFGASRLFVLGSLVGGALYLTMPLLPTVPFLVLNTLLISFCMPLRFVPLSALFYEQLETLGDGKAGWARGSHMGGSTVLGPALAAALALVMSYGRMYWVIAALFLVTMLMSSLVFRGSRVRSGERVELVRQLRAIFADVDLRGACLVDFTAMAIIGFFNFFVVVIAVADLQLGAETASAMVSLHGVIYVSVLFMGGETARKLGQATSYLLSASTMAVGLVLLGTAREVLQLGAGSMLLGVGVGFLQIVNLVRFARIGARLGRGKIAGLNALTGPGGSLTASLIGGALGHRLGLQNVFLCFVPALGVLLWQLRGQARALAPVAAE